jgi:two-component system sensor histidine kinase PilS (NtrC family)
MITRTSILWAIVVRLILSTLLLGIGAAVESVSKVFLGYDTVLSALLVIYFLCIIYLLLAFFNSRHALQLKLQIFGDLVIVTFLIFLSGEVASPYSSLYLVIIAYATLLSGKNDGYAATAASTILYVGMIDLGHFDLIPFAPMSMSFETLNFRIAIVVTGFVSVSFLSSSLSERLKKVRKELEEKSGSLADLQVFSENILESLRSGLITADLEGNIQTVNYAAAMLTDVPLNQLVGKPLATLLPEEFVAWLLTEDVAIREEPLRKEFWFHSPAGRHKYLGFSVSPLYNQKNELIGHITSFQDLTEVKRLQEEVAIKDKMAAIGHMAAAIAHEIRNPLASMHGSIQLLRKEFQLQGEDVRLMDIILRESNRLNKIIEDFLIYARPRQVELVRLNLNEILEETLSLLRNDPSLKKEHELVLECNGAPLMILGDADLMRQVCWNLATNSLKAMPAGGRLRIEGKVSEDNYVRLRFTDNGVGMDTHEKEKLFQPFHSSFSQGLGIGMAIVYQIVDQHHGRMNVESERGRGTTVELEFISA